MENDIRFINDNTLLVYQNPGYDITQLKKGFDYTELMIHDKDQINVVLDISDCSRPNAETRDYLRTRISKIDHKFKHVAAVIGGNYLLLISLKFVFGFINLKKVSIHSSREKAIAHIGQL